MPKASHLASGFRRTCFLYESCVLPEPQASDSGIWHWITCLGTWVAQEETYRFCNAWKTIWVMLLISRVHHQHVLRVLKCTCSGNHSADKRSSWIFLRLWTREGEQNSNGVCSKELCICCRSYPQLKVCLCECISNSRQKAVVGKLKKMYGLMSKSSPFGVCSNQAFNEYV